MSLDMDRGASPAREPLENTAAAKQLVPAQGTPQQRQPDEWHAVAHGDLVVGTRGRVRLVLVVTRCPFCRCSHAHNAGPDFVNGRRKAACGGGRYVVHVAYVEGREAA